MRQIKQLKVKVNQEEIDNAIRGNSRNCMYVKSIERQYPALKRVFADKHHVRFTDPKRNLIYTFDMPPQGRAQLLLFDEGAPMNSFGINLKNPTIRTRVLRNDASEKSGRKLRAVTPDDRKADADTAVRSQGPVLTPKTKMGRAIRGVDRVYGAKLFSEELKKLRTTLGVGTATA